MSSIDEWIKMLSDDQVVGMAASLGIENEDDDILRLMVSIQNQMCDE